IDCQPLALGRWRDARGLAATEQLDAVAERGLVDEFRRVSVFMRQDAVHRLDEVHLAAETGERLRQLASDRSSADDTQAWRQFGQRKDRFVREIAGLL